MGDSKVIEMFDSLPKFETYSKYSHTLGRIFTNSSLDGLLKNLKNPKRFEDSNSNKHEKNYTDNINLEEQIARENNIIDEENDVFDEKYDKKNLKNTKTNEIKENANIDNNLKRRKIIQENPDPYKYHPNYNAIYKNVPTVRFMLPRHKKPKLRINDKLKLKIKGNENPVLLTDINVKHNKTMSNNNINSQEKGEESKDLNKSKNSKKIKSNLPLLSKSNHALRFSKYTWRKFIIPKLHPKYYLEPYNYLDYVDKTIDFNKMKPRNEMEMLNKHNLETPSINYYNPKYKIVENRSPMFSFTTRNYNPKENKRYLLTKLWASYNVTQEYKLVDNEKLGEKNYNYLQFGN